MIDKHFRHQPKLRLKKLRGKSRYFQRIRRLAQDCVLDLTSDNYCNMYHYHAGLSGYGNLSWNFREEHIGALCIVYRNFAEALKYYDKPYQLFIILNRDDASQDAVFFHEPNPNRDSFPAKYSDADWGIPELEKYFSDRLSPYKFRAGKSTYQGSQIYYIYCQDIGVLLE